MCRAEDGSIALANVACHSHSELTIAENTGGKAQIRSDKLRNCDVEMEGVRASLLMGLCDVLENLGRMVLCERETTNADAGSGD